MAVPSDAFELALRQREPGGHYCRTLDRMHLAIASALGLKRFMTNDKTQAVAAASLGFKLILPR